MRILTLSDKTLKHAAQEATKTIRAGGVVMIPTDTCYGLAADPDNRAALAKLYIIKRRDKNKKVSTIYSSVKQIAECVRLTSWQKTMLKKNLPGPFTFIINGKAVRIPDYLFTKTLANMLNAPYTATSANISGSLPLYSVANAHKEFRSMLPDLVIDSGDLPSNPPSTVIDISNNQMIIVRAGAYRPLI